MMTGYIVGTAQFLADFSEATGRKYASDVGISYPMPPETYGPGRQPEPRGDYYQKYYVAAVPPTGSLPARVEVDAVADSMSGSIIRIRGSNFTINTAGKLPLPVRPEAARDLTTRILR